MSSSAHSPKASFSKSVGQIFVSKILLIILKMGSSVVTSRFLGPTGRGIYVLVAQIPGFFTMFSNLSIGEALSVLIGRKTITRKQAFAVTMCLWLLSSILTMIVYYFGLPLLQKYSWKNTPPIYGQIAGLMIPAVLGEYYCLFSLRGAMEFKLLARLSVLSRLFLLVAMYVSLALFKVDTYGLVVVYIFAQLFLVLCYFVATAWVSDFKWEIKQSILKAVYKYGALVHVSTLLSDLEYRADVYLMAFFLQAEDIGLYSISVTVAQLSWYFTNSINTVFLPKLSALEAKETAHHTNIACRISFGITAFLNLGLGLGGYYLIWFFYGKSFLPSYSVLLLLLPGITMDSVFRILSSYFKTHNLLASLSTYSVVSLIVNVAVNLILIPRWGIKGAAISSSVSYSLKAVLVWYSYVKHSKSRVLESVLITKSDIQQILKRALKLRQAVTI